MAQAGSSGLKEWISAAETVQRETVALRRAIHAEPELGLKLPRTTAKLKAALQGMPLELREGPSTTGLVAVLHGTRPGRTVLLRGDMDALPMPEDVDLPFRSRIAGAMHACGHDAHTAMLVSAARLLAARRDRFAGTIYFMFQPGEEGWHGARYMLKDGLLDPMPDAAFALHIAPNAPAGTFGSRVGALLASADVVSIRVKGRGGHASMPHDAIDPVPIACEIVTALQAFVTRRLSVADPAVITIAKIEAGTTNNVIPETASLVGTIRALSERTRALAQEGIERIATHVALAHGAEATLRFERGYPVTLCDARAVQHMATCTAALFGEDAWQTMAAPVMGAEDFAYVLQKVPGAMAFLGVCPEGTDWQNACPCHSNRMVLNESVLARGVALHGALAESFLAEGFAA